MAHNQVNYCRIWLNHSCFLFESQQSGVFDKTAVNNLDRFLALAHERGIRVKLCLEYFRAIRPEKNKWADNTVHHKANGGQFSDMLDFMQTENGINHFRKKIAWYGNRYGNNPAIFAWELWNEVNCVGPAWLWAPWTRTMLAELKQLSPKNMALQSLGSFDREKYRVMYGILSTFADNDIAQVHRYLDLGAEWDVCHGPVDILAAEAIAELKAFGSGKPIILAESGAVEPRHSGPFKYYKKDVEGTLLHDILWSPFMAGAAGPGQIWHWDHYIEQNNIWWQFYRFAEAVKGIDPPAENFEPFLIKHPRLRVYVLKGEKTVLMWCRDKENNWETELQNEIEPENLTNISINLTESIRHWTKRIRPDLSPVLASEKHWEGHTYNPWTNTWLKTTINDNTIALPPFKRSIVIRLNVSENNN
jgi:hypothetical protein